MKNGIADRAILQMVLRRCGSRAIRSASLFEFMTAIGALVKLPNPFLLVG
jgi:hypothetical protein